jgi:GT2 family glycosyltransferase/glycosyltransferase involved in cell wall biosynthesis
MEAVGQAEGEAGRGCPRVSVVVLAFNGRDHLRRCLPTLLAQTYPRERLELIVVDNGSTDGGADYVAEQFPSVRVVRNRANYGFARGNNIGAELATGELVAFLNQDTRADPDWVTELVAPIVAARRQGDETLACTAAKIVSWDGALVDFVGARMNFLGKASQLDFGQPVDPRYDVERPMLFACGGAMLIDRRVFLEVGGFDEDYFVFFEDVDLGWRLWVLGYRVQLAPKAITYHRLHASTASLGDARRQLVYERNALYSSIKNYDDANLARVLPASLLLTVQRVVAELRPAGLRREDYDVRRPASGRAECVPLNAGGASLLLALADLTEHMPALLDKRAVIQGQRRRPDAEIAPLFGGPFEPMAGEPGHAETTFRLTNQLGVNRIFEHVPRHVLVITTDLLPLPGLPASGAGLRAWGIGQGLTGRGHRVTYAMHARAMAYAGGNVPEGLQAAAWTEATLTEVAHRVNPDLVVACGWYPAAWLDTDHYPLVIDQHGPHLLERSFHKDHNADLAEAARQKLGALARADLFTCAGERQRLYFEPWLLQAGFDLTRPEEQPVVLPLTMSPDLPTHAPAGEVTFVYGGVFLPWQDPTIGLTALVEALEAHGQGRLAVYGGAHPLFPEVGTGVFPRLRARLERSPHAGFEPLTPHAELLRRYARAHAAIDLMRRNPERELAVTTRTVEYLWCGLPVIYNDYSELSDYIREYEAGWTLDPEDGAGVRAIVETILRNPAIALERGRNAQRLVRERLTWEQGIEPLDRFVRRPWARTKARPILLPEPAASSEFRVPSSESEPATGRPEEVPPPPTVPVGLEPVLRDVAARRRSPAGQALALARRLAKSALGSDRSPRLGAATLPDLVGGRVHGQTIAPTEDGLCGVAVRFGGYRRLNTQDVTFRLRAEDEPDRELASATVNASLLPDGEFYAFRFRPIADSKGRRFIFSLESPGSVEGDAVTLWAELTEGVTSDTRYEDGRPRAGRLAYRLIYAAVGRDEGGG